jgi:hypothetical protein
MEEVCSSILYITKSKAYIICTLTESSNPAKEVLLLKALPS